MFSLVLTTVIKRLIILLLCCGVCCRNRSATKAIKITKARVSSASLAGLTAVSLMFSVYYSFPPKEIKFSNRFYYAQVM